MVGRLKDVIGKLIFDSHSSFFPKKGILDGILVLNEVVEFARRNSKRLFLFKVDFKKYFVLSLVIMKNSRATHSFHPFSFSENLRAYLLQFTSCTMLVGEPTWECLWSINSMLQGFDLSSCLSITSTRVR